jgi:uncharacterized protein
MEQTEPGILPLVRRVKAELAAHYGERLAEVYLFGSHARGEAGPDSDVDVLVVLYGELDWWEEQKVIVGLLYGLELETEELISAIPVSASRFARNDVPLHRNIHREGITV